MTDKERQLKVLYKLRTPLDKLVLWAFHYHFGKPTTNACTFAEGLIRAWDVLDNGVKFVITETINDAHGRDVIQSIICSESVFGGPEQAKSWLALRGHYRSVTDGERQQKTV